MDHSVVLGVAYRGLHPDIFKREREVERERKREKEREK
jgi:hypothetical protein